MLLYPPPLARASVSAATRTSVGMSYKLYDLMTEILSKPLPTPCRELIYSLRTFPWSLLLAIPHAVGWGNWEWWKWILGEWNQLDMSRYWIDRPLPFFLPSIPPLRCRYQLALSIGLFLRTKWRRAPLVLFSSFFPFEMFDWCWVDSQLCPSSPPMRDLHIDLESIFWKGCMAST